MQCWLGKASLLFGKEIKNQSETQSSFLISECYPIHSIGQRFICSSHFPKRTSCRDGLSTYQSCTPYVSYFNQVARLLLLREEGHGWRARGGKAICEVKEMRRKGTQMHCQSQPGQQGPGLALTQLALSGVGGSLRECCWQPAPLVSKGRQIAWNVNGLWLRVRVRGNEASRQPQGQWGRMRVAEAGRYQGCRVEGCFQWLSWGQAARTVKTQQGRTEKKEEKESW